LDSIIVQIMSKERFKNLSLAEKYKRLKSDGHHLASRFFGGFHVHLFRLDTIYVEAWYRIGLNHLCWIEEVDYRKVVDEYADNIDISKLLG
jgi:predicted metallopeptidase